MANENTPEAFEINEHRIFEALVDAQVGAVRPDALTVKEQVYGTKPSSEPYASMGISYDRMSFDVEVWFPLIDELRSNGVLLSVAETRRMVQENVGKSPVELWKLFATQSQAAKLRQENLK